MRRSNVLNKEKAIWQLADELGAFDYVWLQEWDKKSEAGHI